MELFARIRLLVWEGGSLWVTDANGPANHEGRRTEPHAHHAIQIILSLGGAFRLDVGGRDVGGEAAAVAADVTHVFAAKGLVALLFVEPESRAGRAIAASLFQDADFAPLSPAMLGDLPARIAAGFGGPARDDRALVELGRALVARIAGGVAVPEPDVRVRRMIAWAGRQIDGPVSLADVGPVGGLSPGRLRHLFVEQTGLAFRTYLLWLRLTRALDGLAAGASLTESAHQAGFADSAHFSRTFKRMFGVAPATLRIS